jgi:hypothetical protein
MRVDSGMVYAVRGLVLSWALHESKHWKTSLDLWLGISSATCLVNRQAISLVPLSELSLESPLGLALAPCSELSLMHWPKLLLIPQLEISLAL